LLGHAMSPSKCSSDVEWSDQFDAARGWLAAGKRDVGVAVVRTAQ
jgi:hypothetical protein